MRGRVNSNHWGKKRRNKPVNLGQHLGQHRGQRLEEHLGQQFEQWIMDNRRERVRRLRRRIYFLFEQWVIEHLIILFGLLFVFLASLIGKGLLRFAAKNSSPSYLSHPLKNKQSVKLTNLSKDQVDDINIPIDGPYKPPQYKHRGKSE
ncbi:unnamed protein product [Ilex paraguariensis]|uniref:Uncharacterized protein n=1 Tax=Ilex paraguariensis TaxID=185542 RepID=A0ABC8UM41_9AQUA